MRDKRLSNRLVQLEGGYSGVVEADSEGVVVYVLECPNLRCRRDTYQGAMDYLNQVLREMLASGREVPKPLANWPAKKAEAAARKSTPNLAQEAQADEGRYSEAFLTRVFET